MIMEKNPETKETVLELKPEDMEKVSGGGEPEPPVKPEEKDR